ncbi:MAG: phage tail protein [Pacificimonas sp.]
MATVILTAVGAAVGGPIGAAVGTLVGNQVDAAIFAPKGREGPRLADLRVQGSDYGAPLPRHYGRVRSAGTVIWSNGLTETEETSGGGKKSGGKTTTYSYSASFAVAIAGRPIAGIERIWADGKLLRGAGGDMLVGGEVRVYRGDERQLPDPLIAAVEGPDAPPCRGLGYIVFEDLQLADFANRIPNISCEIVADHGVISAGEIIYDLARAVDADVEADKLVEPIAGFSASRNSALSAFAGQLDVMSPMVARSSGGTLSFAPDRGGDVAVAYADALLPLATTDRPRMRTMRASDDASPSVLTLAANDPARDFQPSVQRAFRSRRAGGGPTRHFDLPVTLGASDAKRIAETQLSRLAVKRSEGVRRLPLWAARLSPGDVVQIVGDGDWSIERSEMDGLGVTLTLSPRAGLPPVTANAEGGAALIEADIPQGETVHHIFELPTIGGEPRDMIRLYVAAGGASDGWRRAGVHVSRDGGTSYQGVGTIGVAAKMGVVWTALPRADFNIWDDANEVVVDLIDNQALASVTREAVLAGANLALIGAEVVQFTTAEEVGPRRWRLTGLLRGRRGTEAAVDGHVDGETFVLIENGGVLSIDLPLSDVGRLIGIKTVGPADSLPAASERTIAPTGLSLRPLAPVFGRATFDEEGVLHISWTRRSRVGHAWLDGVGTPLSEERELYRVTLSSDLGDHVVESAKPELTFGTAEQVAALGAQPTSVEISVQQVSAEVGAGTETRMSARRPD